VLISVVLIPVIELEVGSSAVSIASLELDGWWDNREDWGKMTSARTIYETRAEKGQWKRAELLQKGIVCLGNPVEKSALRR